MSLIQTDDNAIVAGATKTPTRGLRSFWCSCRAVVRLPAVANEVGAEQYVEGPLVAVHGDTLDVDLDALEERLVPVAPDAVVGTCVGASAVTGEVHRLGHDLGHVDGGLFQGAHIMSSPNQLLRQLVLLGAGDVVRDDAFR